MLGSSQSPCRPIFAPPHTRTPSLHIPNTFRPRVHPSLHPSRRHDPAHHLRPVHNHPSHPLPHARNRHVRHPHAHRGHNHRTSHVLLHRRHLRRGSRRNARLHLPRRCADRGPSSASRRAEGRRDARHLFVNVSDRADRRSRVTGGKERGDGAARQEGRGGSCAWICSVVDMLCGPPRQRREKSGPRRCTGTLPRMAPRTPRRGTKEASFRSRIPAPQSAKKNTPQAISWMKQKNSCPAKDRANYGETRRPNRPTFGTHPPRPCPDATTSCQNPRRHTSTTTRVHEHDPTHNASQTLIPNAIGGRMRIPRPPHTSRKKTRQVGCPQKEIGSPFMESGSPQRRKKALDEQRNAADAEYCTHKRRRIPTHRHIHLLYSTSMHPLPIARATPRKRRKKKRETRNRELTTIPLRRPVVPPRRRRACAAAAGL
ncbi:hypothetical protein C8R47DRAFT_704373 [Mycena vitilis]|nr:hypothetical protein C8R47DRAFT_704373 [Mycena vitilis]